MDSVKVVSILSEIDTEFVALCKTLFGDVVDPEDIWDYMYSVDGISKMNPEPSEVSTPSRGKFVRAVTSKKGKIAAAGVAAGVGTGAAAKVASQRKKEPSFRRIYDDTGDVGKSQVSDIVWEGTFSKFDEDKRQVFGWASVVQIDGKPVVDSQGDVIDPEDIEKAAYTYVETNRKGGHQHKRTPDDQPFHASNLIESFVVTPEKIEKMGLPKDTPCGWWVGYKVTDEDTWSGIKKGRVTGFSIHGRGKRKELVV